jgi:glycosyltransferase involved in cell wall biosynthesis
MTVFFSIVVATLKRPSYAGLVQSIRNQTLQDWELVARYDPDVNEYASRNLAAAGAQGEYLVFTDDDCVMPSNYLAIAMEDIQRGSWPSGLSGPLMVPMGNGQIQKIDQPTWGIGANLIVRRNYFEELGGFEVDWGLPYSTDGWRSDTDLYWRLEDKYPGKLKYSPRLVMNHIPPMQSQWVPEVEAIFFQRWRKKVMDRFVPVDMRLQEFLLGTQDLTEEERKYIVGCRLKCRKVLANASQAPVLKEEKEFEGLIA